MAISPSINMLALDIGGVVADIDVKFMTTFLKKNHLDESDFFNEDFSLLQMGKIKPADFFRKKTRSNDLAVADLLAAFKMMINAVHAREILRKIKVPYFFLSNINQIHFHELRNQIELSDFTNENSLLSYQVGCLKPGTDFFKAADAINLIPWQTLYIDDAIANLTMGQRHGLITAHCPKTAMLSTILASFNLI
jgi:FMN phosphatase YigB (HAD superfamily)